MTSPLPKADDRPVKLTAAWLRRLTDVLAALFEKKHGVCPTCEGHRTVCVYDIADEYAAPCPRCVGPEKYLAKLVAKNGSVTAKDRETAYSFGRSALSSHQGGEHGHE